MNSLTKENTRLGFIGIGNMGSRMAKRLLDHGYQVIAYNRSREAAEALVKYGATVADSIAELASEADVILSSLTNDDAVKSVYTDPKGVFAHLRRGSAIIEMSTVLPATSRELYDLSREAGVKFLDSPVSGSTPSAEEGTLTLFCGGDEELFQAAQVLSHTAVIAPAHLGKLSRADVGDYSAQFAIRLMNKDFGLVLATAAAAKVPMPATAAAFQMNLAEFAECKEEDFSAVIALMERLAHVETLEAANRRVAGTSSV